MPTDSNDMWLFNNRRIYCETKRSWLPRKCFLSGRSLFMKKSQVVVSMVAGAGEIAHFVYWCDPQEFLIHELKR